MQLLLANYIIILFALVFFLYKENLDVVYLSVFMYVFYTARQRRHVVINQVAHEL